MPTWEEMDELRKECTWTWTELNGIEGFRVTSKKVGYEDRSIFLPVTEYNNKKDFDPIFSSGYYWSSSINKSVVRDANYLTFGFSANIYTNLCYRRFNGYSCVPSARNTDNYI